MMMDPNDVTIQQLREYYLGTLMVDHPDTRANFDGIDVRAINTLASLYVNHDNIKNQAASFLADNTTRGGSR